MSFLKTVLRGNILVFIIGDIIRQLSMFITFPYFSLYIQALGGSEIDIGLVNSLYPLAAFFVYPIAGYVADRYNRVKIVSISGYVFAALSVIFLLAPTWYFLALGNFLWGLTVFTFPAMNSLMADSLPSHRRGVGYSLWIAIPSAVGIVSPYAGGYLITIAGVEQAMRLLYGLTTFTAVGIATINLKFLRETKPKTGGEIGKKGLFRISFDAYRDVFDTLRQLPRSLKAFMFMLMLSFFINSVTTPFWVVYSIHQIGLSELQWGVVLLVAMIVNLGLLVPAGVIVDKISARKILAITLGLSIVPMISFAFSHTFLETTLVLVALNMTNAFLVSAAPSFMAQAAPIDKRGRVMAALGQGMLLVNTRGGTGGPGMGMVLTIPAVLGSIVGGLIYTYNPSLPWILLAFFTTINTIIAAGFLQDEKRY